MREVYQLQWGPASIAGNDKTVTLADSSTVTVLQWGPASIAGNDGRKPLRLAAPIPMLQWGPASIAGNDRDSAEQGDRGIALQWGPASIAGNDHGCSPSSQSSPQCFNGARLQSPGMTWPDATRSARGVRLHCSLASTTPAESACTLVVGFTDSHPSGDTYRPCENRTALEA